MMDDDPLNLESVIQALEILINKAEEDIVQLEEDIMLLQCQLTWNDVLWSQLCSYVLKKEIVILEGRMQHLRKATGIQPVETPPILLDIVKPILRKYLIEKNKPRSVQGEQKSLPSIEDLPNLTIQKLWEFARAQQIPCCKNRPKAELQCLLLLKLIEDNEEQEVPPAQCLIQCQLADNSNSQGGSIVQYGRDMMEVDSLNVESVIQELKISMDKVDEEILQLEGDIALLKCQLTWNDALWSQLCSYDLKKRVNFLEERKQVRKINKKIEYYGSVSRIQPVEKHLRLHDIVKTLLEKYLTEKNKPSSESGQQKLLPSIEDLPNLTEARLKEFAQAHQIPLLSSLRKPQLQCILLSKLIGYDDEIGVPPANAE